MTGLQLFKNRLNQHFRFYKRLRKLTVDWTVWLYIFIPFSIIGASFYIDIWLQVPEWPTYVTTDFVLFIIVMSLFIGSHYAFLHRADVLYLWQKRELMSALNRFRIEYMSFVTLMKTSLSMALLSPIIIRYLNWDVMSFLKLSILVYVLALIIGILKRETKVRFTKWMYRLMMGVSIGVTYGVVWLVVTRIHYWAMFSIAIIMLVISIMIVLFSRPNIYREIEIDAELRNKLMQLVLMQSAYIGAPDWMVQSKFRTANRPWIFKKSQKLYKAFTPEVAYQEIIIKTYLRRKNWVLLYMQVTFGGMALLILFPGWYKVIIYLLLIYVVGQLLSSYWNQILSARFLELFKSRQVNLTAVSKKIFNQFMLPSVSVFSLVMGYTLLDYWGMFVMLIIGLILSRLLANFLSQKVIM